MNYYDFFNLAKQKDISNIQITEDEKVENSVYLINNKLEDYTDSEKIVYTIKAEVDGKTERVITEYLDENIIDLLLEKINETESNYKDQYLSNKNNNKIAKMPSVDISDVREKLNDLYKEKEKYPLAKSLELAYSENYLKTRIINNNEVDIATDSLSYHFYVESSAEKENEVATYSESVLVTDKRNIDFKNIINRVLELSSLATTKRKLETKRYNIVLSSEVASKIIDHIQDMLSAEYIHQKKSCLANKLDNKIFSEKLNIVEEPRNKNYPGYIIFDKEGTDTKNKEIVTNGVIKTYLYDIKEAKVDGVESTGNKYNSIDGRNMYVKPGSKNLDDIFKSVNNGIYITHFMGSMGTSINTTTGNISMQVFGYIIEDGKLVCGFEPAVLTSSIFELLTNIDDIGNDLQFIMKSTASPTISVSNISIAGE